MKDDRESEVSVSVKCGHSKVHFSQDLFRDIRSMVHSIPYVHRTGKNSSRTLSEKQMDAMRKRAKKKSADFDKRTWTKIEHGFICRRALEGARIKFQWHKDHFEVEEPLSEKIILQLDRSTEKMENRLLKELDRPTYVRVHWQNISLQTLKEFNVPWEWDKKADEYILIKSFFSQDKMEELFAHSKALRAAKADSRTERKLPEGHKDRGEIWTKCAFCCRLGRRCIYVDNHPCGTCSAWGVECRTMSSRDDRLDGRWANLEDDSTTRPSSPVKSEHQSEDDVATLEKKMEE